MITNNLIPLVEAGSITRNLRNCLDVLPQLRSSLADLPPCPALILFDALAGRYAEARAQIVPLLLDRTEFRGPSFRVMHQPSWKAGTPCPRSGKHKIASARPAANARRTCPASAVCASRWP